MASRWSLAAVVPALVAALAMPALAHEDQQWDQDDGSLRQRHHRQRRQQTVVPNGTSNATQPYWGTTQPYWGTTQPYWGPSGAPSQQPHGLTPLNRRPR
jgi:hypothetical protein